MFGATREETVPKCGSRPHMMTKTGTHSGTGRDPTTSTCTCSDTGGLSYSFFIRIGEGQLVYTAMAKHVPSV